MRWSVVPFHMMCTRSKFCVQPHGFCEKPIKKQTKETEEEQKKHTHKCL